MKTLAGKSKLRFTSLSNMLSSEKYQIFESETLLNIQYHIINTNKNIDKMIEANEAGCFGCTHSEFIECWRDFVVTYKNDISQVYRSILESEINECEAYHIKAGTINDEI